MSLSGTRSRLAGLTTELSNHWQETKTQWRDAKCQEFERLYLDELFARVDKTVAVMEKLDEVLARIKKDCE